MFEWAFTIGKYQAPLYGSKREFPHTLKHIQSPITATSKDIVTKFIYRSPPKQFESVNFGYRARESECNHACTNSV